MKLEAIQRQAARKFVEQWTYRRGSYEFRIYDRTKPLDAYISNF